jgi:ketosteroid isomerase-like protein
MLIAFRELREPAGVGAVDKHPAGWQSQVRAAFAAARTRLGGNDLAEHPNAELFRKGYAAFSSGDMDTLRSLFAPDIVWHLPGKNHFSGEHKGVDNVLNLFMQNFQETGGTFKVDMHDAVANDTHAVVMASVSGQREGKSLDDRYVHVVHVKDGLITESWIFGENQDVVDNFWG